MAILIFVLALILLIAAGASGYQSINLLPTGIGVLYALAGAVAACVAVLTLAIAITIRRIDALASLVRESALPPAVPAGPLMPHTTDAAQAENIPGAAAPNEMEAPTSADIAPGVEDESPININRVGRLPSLEIDETGSGSLKPDQPPSLIGSYSSAGANYRIFSDGSIEAETNDGTFKFASMADFKRHLAETKGGREIGV